MEDQKQQLLNQEAVTWIDHQAVGLFFELFKPVVPFESQFDKPNDMKHVLNRVLRRCEMFYSIKFL